MPYIKLLAILLAIWAYVVIISLHLCYYAGLNRQEQIEFFGSSWIEKIGGRLAMLIPLIGTAFCFLDANQRGLNFYSSIRRGYRFIKMRNLKSGPPMLSTRLRK